MPVAIIRAAVSGAFISTLALASAASAQPAAPCPTIASPQWTTDAQTIFIVSTRATNCRNGRLTFTTARADTVNFGEASLGRSSTVFGAATWEQWLAAFKERLRLAPTHRALIFIHGYNNSAESAVGRAVAIRRATGFEGPIIAFVWPSQENFWPYTVDETNAEWTTTYFRWLLTAILTEPSSTSIIAHSMGNRIGWIAVRELGLSNASLASRIGHLVLASPDVDRASLARDLAGDFAALPEVTIYASSVDQALIYSSGKHGSARAGYLGPRRAGQTPSTFPVEAMNTKLIDTTDTRHKLPLQHGDFIETPEGAADLCRVISGAETSAGREADPRLPHTWRLIRNAQPTDICARQAQSAASVLKDR